MNTELDGESGRAAPRHDGEGPGARERWAAFFDLRPTDWRALEATRREREAVADRLLEKFYAHLLTFPILEKFFGEDPERLPRLQELHRVHFLGLEPEGFELPSLTGRFPGREPHWYIGACGVYLALAVGLLAETMQGSPDFAPTICAMIKAVLFHLALAAESYFSDGFVPRETATELARTVTVTTDALRRQDEAARAKDDLINMLVHDLRNPVQGIALQASVALQIASKSLDMERDHLSQIERACRNLSRLLEDMLAAAKLEAGQMPVTTRPIVLGDLLTDVLDEHVPMIERAGMRLTRDVGPELPVIRADPALLRRVLVNLIVNAVLHSGSPEIRVETTTREPDAVSTRVIDYGRGIPAGEQDRIFERYASGTPAVPRTGGATGLGLYFSRLATEQMGGRLRLTSRPGLTVFEVRLPPV